ncbi:hypothetical protein CG447_02255 [Faecalibacterium duncaniae]|nr:hypothetical protein CG447_02255 [Faecalibacterium duncaniae]
MRFRWLRKKLHSSRRLLLMRGIGTLLSAVSVGITDRAGKLYLLGIIFGDFLPCTPCFEVGEYCG